MAAARETTRGAPFDPNVAKRQRKIAAQVRAAEQKRQEDEAYREHFTGQHRYAKRNRSSS